MSYKALYRTYRPQTFEEVAGQKHIVKTLKNALENNKIAHAYLFCGPRGTGKTSMAKLFAKALNCEEGIGHQCNKCSNCTDVIEGSHPDVIEIDAASNNGVEEVRNLIDTVNYLPIKGRYKVYIIDEVHMMTTNAFNALLKTLEEPPSHVVFILATTEPHNILPTIISRCQRYDFNKVSDADIKERLVTILEKEGIGYDDDAVNAVISLADGGVRDALSILDQVLAYSGNTLSTDDVYMLFGLASKEEKIQFIKNIYEGDVALSLDKLTAFSKGGVDLKRLNNDLLEILKDVLIYKKTGIEQQLTSIREEDAIELSNLMDIGSLNAMIGAFLKAQIDFKTASNIKTLFEVTILKLCTQRDEPVAPQIKEKPIGTPSFEKKFPKEEVKIEKPVVQEKPVIQEVKPTLEKPSLVEPLVRPEVKVEPKPVQKEKPKVEEPPSWLFDDEETKDKQVVEVEGDKYQLDDNTIIKLMVLGDKFEKRNLLQRWNELDSYIMHPQLGDMVALLKDGRPYILTKDVLVLDYDFSNLANKVNIKSNQDHLSKIMSKMLGRDIFVYAISRSESTRIYRSYQNLSQISALPKASTISIDVKEFK